MKIIRIAIIFILMSLLMVFIKADEFNPLIYQYNNPDITITFLTPLEISPERQKEIADSIAGISDGTELESNIVFPTNIICTIFGHDLAPEGTVTATHHKVRQYNPRCLMEIYHVTYCKRCDYAVSELDNDFYIICCPED